MRLGLGAVSTASPCARQTPELAARDRALRGATARSASAARPSGDVPGAAEARALYKALGLDPTKTRPSNEALLRRVLKGEPLYRVNTLVDALNLCFAARSSCPFGLYDLAQRARRRSCCAGARGAKSYEGIRKARGQRRTRGRCWWTRTGRSATRPPTRRAP